MNRNSGESVYDPLLDLGIHVEDSVSFDRDSTLQCDGLIFAVVIRVRETSEVLLNHHHGNSPRSMDKSVVFRLATIDVAKPARRKLAILAHVSRIQTAVAKSLLLDKLKTFCERQSLEAAAHPDWVI